MATARKAKANVKLVATEWAVSVEGRQIGWVSDGGTGFIGRSCESGYVSAPYYLRATAIATLVQAAKGAK